MSYQNQAISAGMSLDNVISRLKQHVLVNGICMVGSYTKDALTPASDYDIVIVIDKLDVPINVGFTTIDGRPTDLVFYLTSDIESLVTLDSPIEPNSHLGHIFRQLLEAQIVYDRSGLVKLAVDNIMSSDWLTLPSGRSAYSAWFQLNFNLAHLRLLMTASDEIRQTVAEIRMTVYGATELLWNYFTIRQLFWSGEKDAVRYLKQHDPIYLEQYLLFLREENLETKFSFYEKMVDAASQPMGGRWQYGKTYWQLADDIPMTSEINTKLDALWSNLLGD